tara:strand:+ start:88 stop:858 length:771 start_codon:yes stop_codon:yes gene_type:complete
MPHISYSELKNWHHCPFYHKLVNIQKLKVFEGNEYTAFGTALHSVCEDLLTDEVDIPKPELFNQKFRDEIKKLKSEEINKKLIVDMFAQGGKLSEQVLPSLENYFDDCEVFMAEEKLYEPISGTDDYLFKGYVDLIVKEGDNYHIIDWKTCSWGWDSRKRSDKMILYQLILYKHFFCQKYDISPDMVHTHFGLLKRTSKKNIVELFKVTSGPKRIENALELLHKAIQTIKSGVHIKNKLSCTSGYGCDLYKTKHCN